MKYATCSLFSRSSHPKTTAAVYRYCCTAMSIFTLSRSNSNNSGRKEDEARHTDNKQMVIYSKESGTNHDPAVLEKLHDTYTKKYSESHNCLDSIGFDWCPD